MDSNFNILYPMVVMICQCCVFNMSDIAIMTVKIVDYRCIMYNISKFKAINLLENYVLEDRRYM